MRFLPTHVDKPECLAHHHTRQPSPFPPTLSLEEQSHTGKVSGAFVHQAPSGQHSLVNQQVASSSGSSSSSRDGGEPGTAALHQ